MSKKGLNIHKRADGRWEGRYKIGQYENGNTKFCSVYGKTRDEVTEKLLAAYSSGMTAKRKTNERTFTELLQLWLRYNRLRQKGATEHKYRMIIENHIVPELGELNLSDINSVIINSFLERQLTNGRIKKGGGLSPSYVRTMAIIIQSDIQFSSNDEYCDPLKSTIYTPSLVKKELQILTKGEQTHLESYILSNGDAIGLGVLITLYAGLRIGEVCALTWNDIDLNNLVIRIRHTIARVRCADITHKATTQLILDSPKTASSVRDIPISSVLLPHLTEFRTSYSNEYVISESSDFVSPRTYEYRFHRLLKQCGIQQVNYHVLRHTFATRCIEAGMDVKSLSELLGHSNVGITLNTYVHSSMERKREQLEMLQTTRKV